MKKYFTVTNITAVAVTGITLILLNSTRHFFPELVVNIFSYPAAKLSSLFLGTQCLKGDELTFIIPHPLLELHVIESCSGYNFWLIFFSFFTFQLFRKLDIKSALKYLALLLPVSLCITLLANTMRIISAFFTAIFSAASFTYKYSNVLHMWLGILIFLPALIISYIIFERRFANEQ